MFIHVKFNMFDGLGTWQDGKILEYPFSHVFLYQSTVKLSCNLVT